jgi:putative peptidoglycan lipid II flippase
MLRLSLGTLAAAQLALQLILQITLLRLVGVGTDTDAYVAALTVPVLMQSVLALSLQSVWQPRLAVVAGNATEWRAAQGVAQGQVTLVFLGTAAVLFTCADLWVGALFPGFSELQRQLTAKLTRIMLIGAIFIGQATLFTAALRAREQFISGELVPLIGSAAAIAAVVFTVRDYGIEAAAWTNMARSMAVCLTLFWLADRPPIDLLGAWRSETWRKVFPVLAGSSLYKTSPVIDRFWASQGGVGGVTIYNLVQMGMGAIASVLERALTTSLTPRLARFGHAADLRSMRALFRRCLWQGAVAVAAIAILLIAFRPWWDDTVGNLLRIPGSRADEMWLLCLLLLGYLHVAGCGSIVVAAFYALGDTKTPIVMSVMSFLGGVLLKSVAFLMFELPGLALATSVYYVFNLAALCLLFERRIHV